MARVLIVDAYPSDGRANLRAAGGTEGGELYRQILGRIAPELVTEVIYAADGELPDPAEASNYDGVTWTGSNLSIVDADDPRVARQVELVRSLLDEGIPNFGSCFALQLAAVARGGRCGTNPKGREFGIARDIHLSAMGLRHPLYRGKPERFDAFTSHADHVVELPESSQLLAENAWSPVQGACYDDGPESFWAVQYHPEYDLHEVASLARLREGELIDQGSFADEAACRAWVAQLEALHEDPSRQDIADELGIGPSLLDEDLRTAEVRNWLLAKVLAPE